MTLSRVTLIVLSLAVLLPPPGLGIAQSSARPPEPPRASVDIPALATAGHSVTVPSGGDFQAALNRAQPGDTIVLDAGATYTGPFTLPSKAGPGWVTIRSNRTEQGLPPAGSRVGPEHADLMPKLVTSSGSAVIAAPGAHHYRFIGVEIRPAKGVFLYNLVLLGLEETTPESVPHHIIFERSYLHGDPRAGTRRGIAMNGAHIAVVDSYLSDFKDAPYDSQAICGWNGPGPFKIVNNYLEASGENVMFGGAPPALANVIPSDIEVRGNHFAKPLAWKTERWVVKNLFELKNGRRVLLDGNVFEHSWLHAQKGFAIVLTPRGEAKWGTVEDIAFTNNVVRDANGGFNIMGHDDPGGASGRTSRILIRNNLFDEITGALFQILFSPTDLTIERNTANVKIAITFVEGAPTENFVFRNNLMSLGQYGLIGSGTAPGLGTLNQYFPGAVVQGNVFFGDQPPEESKRYPAGNVFTSLAAVGFVGPTSGDWRLRPDSPFGKRRSEGKEVGADFADLQAHLRGNAALLLPRKVQ